MRVQPCRRLGLHLPEHVPPGPCERRSFLRIPSGGGHPPEDRLAIRGCFRPECVQEGQPRAADHLPRLGRALVVATTECGRALILGSPAEMSNSREWLEITQARNIFEKDDRKLARLLCAFFLD